MLICANCTCIYYVYMLYVSLHRRFSSVYMLLHGCLSYVHILCMLLSLYRCSRVYIYYAHIYASIWLLAPCIASYVSIVYMCEFGSHGVRYFQEYHWIFFILQPVFGISLINFQLLSLNKHYYAQHTFWITIFYQLNDH